jgi:hypothetical protein
MVSEVRALGGGGRVAGVRASTLDTKAACCLRPLTASKAAAKPRRLAAAEPPALPAARRRTPPLVEARSNGNSPLPAMAPSITR